jgi:antitoxin (DNA-binding transcriptional repressor) of toxin-antitoxin stability system
MKTVSMTELGRRPTAILRWVRSSREAVLVTSRGRAVAHILPGTPEMTASEVFEDLFGTLADSAAEGWVRESRSCCSDTIERVGDSWDS